MACQWLNMTGLAILSIVYLTASVDCCCLVANQGLSVGQDFGVSVQRFCAWWPFWRAFGFCSPVAKPANKHHVNESIGIIIQEFAKHMGIFAT